MLRGLLILLSCQLLGELVVHVLDVTVPGPVVGLLLFFAWLAVTRPSTSAGEIRVAEGLLKHLQLLFVPAGVGVVAYLDTLGRHAMVVVVALLGSWLVAVVVTAVVTVAGLRFGPSRKPFASRALRTRRGRA